MLIGTERSANARKQERSLKRSSFGCMRLESMPSHRMNRKTSRQFVVAIVLLAMAAGVPHGKASVAEYDASLDPTDGDYLHRDTLSVFAYSSATGVLAYARAYEGGVISTDEQDGECVYLLHPWEDANAVYTVGTCVSVRVPADNPLSYTLRLDSRMVNGRAMVLHLDVQYVDSDGAAVGAPVSLLRVTCFSAAVQNCAWYMPGQLDVSSAPEAAAAHCMIARLDAYELGSPQEFRRVTAPCRPLA